MWRGRVPRETKAEAARFFMTYSEIARCHFAAILVTSKSLRPAQIQREGNQTSLLGGDVTGVTAEERAGWAVYLWPPLETQPVMYYYYPSFADEETETWKV